MRVPNCFAFVALALLASSSHAASEAIITEKSASVRTYFDYLTDGGSGAAAPLPLALKIDHDEVVSAISGSISGEHRDEVVPEAVELLDSLHRGDFLRVPNSNAAREQMIDFVKSTLTDDEARLLEKGAMILIRKGKSFTKDGQDWHAVTDDSWEKTLREHSQNSGAARLVIIYLELL